MDEVSIGEDIAAEIQLSAESAAKELQAQNETLNSLISELRSRDLIRDVEGTDDELTISIITADSRDRPAFSGLLFGVTALRLEMTFSEGTVIDVSSTARADLGTCDFGDGYRRIRWRERELITELLESTITDGSPDLVVHDKPLTITRQDMLTYDESAAKDAWDEMLAALDEFWDTHIDSIRPLDDAGPFVVGLSKMRSSLLFSALRDGERESFAEDVSADLIETIYENREQIREVGPTRTLDRLLQSGTRTIAYPFSESNLDRRWLPTELKNADVQGLFYRPSREADVMHLELPGQATAYSQEMFDRIATILAAGQWLERLEIPVPLWYAREECKFPEAMLDLYYKEIADDRGGNSDV